MDADEIRRSRQFPYQAILLLQVPKQKKPVRVLGCGQATSDLRGCHRTLSRTRGLPGRQSVRCVEPLGLLRSDGRTLQTGGEYGRSSTWRKSTGLGTRTRGLDSASDRSRHLQSALRYERGPEQENPPSGSRFLTVSRTAPMLAGELASALCRNSATGDRQVGICTV